MRTNEPPFKRDGSYTPSKARYEIEKGIEFLEHIDPAKMTRQDTDNLRVVNVLLGNIRSRHAGYTNTPKDQ